MLLFSELSMNSGLRVQPRLSYSSFSTNQESPNLGIVICSLPGSRIAQSLVQNIAISNRLKIVNSQVGLFPDPYLLPVTNLPEKRFVSNISVLPTPYALTLINKLSPRLIVILEDPVALHNELTKRANEKGVVFLHDLFSYQQWYNQWSKVHNNIEHLHPNIHVLSFTNTFLQQQPSILLQKISSYYNIKMPQNLALDNREFLPDTAIFKPIVKKPKQTLINITTIPKSGTQYLDDKLQKMFPNDIAFPPLKGMTPNIVFEKDKLQQLCNTTRATKLLTCNHLAPNKTNVDIISQTGGKIMVHIRDPRQLILSLIMFNDNRLCQANIRSILELQYPIVPVNYTSMSLSEKIDYFIDHYLPEIIKWIEGWIKISEDNNGVEVLFTTFQEMKYNPNAIFQRLLTFFEIDTYQLQQSDMSVGPNFRLGELDEFRTVFTSEQITRATAMIPPELIERFSWEETYNDTFIYHCKANKISNMPLPTMCC